MSAPAASRHPASARIDRWLFAVRLFKSRSLAAQAVSGGRVHVNGARVKPAHEVRPGDRVSFARGTVQFECAVAGVPRRRGPAGTAGGCYEGARASAARGGGFGTRLKLAAGLTPRPAPRPDERDRRLVR